MSLASGTRLGVYEVLAPLGAGGMGEVYRARDSRLGREVAIKVLPADVANDPERLARFEREARLLASLNHANIAHVYGFEGATLNDGTAAHFLAMELVEGEDLAERLRRGPIPVDEALEIAKQIAQGLEEAHARDIVHRDLKPANIKLTPEGRIKILDFGLAKAWTGASSAASSGDLSQSPTLGYTGTAAGLILGTAAYMSPEQARGKPVDKRADIWAFGVVLFEMLTGKQMFAGDTLSDVLAAVLKESPRWEELPSGLPSSIRWVLQRCLAKDPRDRLHDIADARIELSGAPREGAVGAVVSAALPTRARWRWIAIALVMGIVGAGLGAAAVWLRARPESPEGTGKVRFTVTPPGAGGRVVALRFSGDGRRLVYTLSSERRVLVHDLDQFDSRPIAGTDGASRPFLSPDGRWIGFYQGGKIRKVAFDGGDPTNICDGVDETPGAAWGASGVILFSPAWTNTGLWRVDANGGQPDQVTTPDRSKGETGHFWPDFLPDGRAALFTIWGGQGLADAKVGLLDLESLRYALLFEGAAPTYVGSGHILYYRGGAYRTVPFDAARRQVTGPETTVLPQVRRLDPTGTEGHYASFVPTGALAYVEDDSTVEAPLSRLVWLSRDGRIEELSFEGHHGRPSLSPDGTRVAVNRVDQGQHQVFVYDLTRATAEQLTRDGQNWDATWHPDGRRIAMTSQTSGHFDVRSVAADGTSKPEPLLAMNMDEGDWQWAPDGKSAVFKIWSPVSGTDIWRARADGSDRAPLLASPLSEGDATFSPDGTWLAYRADRSLYVTPYPSLGQRVLIAPVAAGRARWSRSTPELFYVDSGQLKAVAYTLRGNVFQPAPATTLFDLGRLGTDFDVAPDGRRFLFLARAAGRPDRDVVRVVLNGFEELRAGKR